MTSEFPLNWTVLLPVILGFLSIWYLLPTPRPRQVVFGLLGGLVAVCGVLVFFAKGLDRPLPFNPEGFLFAAFSCMAIGFSGLMVTQRNPARAAISFAVVVLSVCGLFLLMAAPFLMAATIIIYAGAIIVTFLFVIMLSQQAGYSDANDRSREPALSAAVGFILLGTLLVVLQRVYNVREIENVIAQADQYARAENIDENLRDKNRLDAFKESVDRSLVRLGFASISTVNDPKLRQQIQQINDASIGLWGEIELNQPQGVRQNMADIRDSLRYLKSVRDGLTTPQTNVVLSPYGQSLNTDTSVEAPRQLPAANIAALGRTMFTDHLLAIEVAGTLLLVATIGTIAISSGRSEKA